MDENIISLSFQEYKTSQGIALFRYLICSERQVFRQALGSIMKLNLDNQLKIT